MYTLARSIFVMLFSCLKVNLVLCRLRGAPTSVPIMAIKFATEATEIDLSTRTEFASGNAYNIRIFAMNSVGQSNSSNEIIYAKPQLEGQLINVKS